MILHHLAAFSDVKYPEWFQVLYPQHSHDNRLSYLL